MRKGSNEKGLYFVCFSFCKTTRGLTDFDVVVVVNFYKNPPQSDFLTNHTTESIYKGDEIYTIARLILFSFTFLHI
jgi:hypothetical protein